MIEQEVATGKEREIMRREWFQGFAVRRISNTSFLPVWITRRIPELPC